MNLVTFLSIKSSAVNNKFRPKYCGQYPPVKLLKRQGYKTQLFRQTAALTYIGRVHRTTGQGGAGGAPMLLCVSVR